MSEPDARAADSAILSGREAGSNGLAADVLGELLRDVAVVGVIDDASPAGGLRHRVNAVPHERLLAHGIVDVAGVGVGGGPVARLVVHHANVVDPVY